MKRFYILLTIAIIVVAGFASYTKTFALFSDNAPSTGNTFTAAATFPAPTIPTAITGAVVINEINWAGSHGDANDEWVELRNTTGNAINLNGWIVENLGTGVGANITIASASAIIPANGFFLIAAKTKANSKINVDPDYIVSSIALSNGGEQLILKTNTSFIMDSANGTTSWLQGSNSTPKKSMERKTPAGDGTVADSWQMATTHTNMDNNGLNDEFATPKATNGL